EDASRRLADRGPDRSPGQGRDRPDRWQGRTDWRDRISPDGSVAQARQHHGDVAQGLAAHPHYDGLLNDEVPLRPEQSACGTVRQGMRMELEWAAARDAAIEEVNDAV